MLSRPSSGWPATRILRGRESMVRFSDRIMLSRPVYSGVLAFVPGGRESMAPSVLSFHILQADGTYNVAGVSAALPPLTPADIQPHLDRRDDLDDNAIVCGFRAWVCNLSPRTP